MIMLHPSTRVQWIDLRWRDEYGGMLFQSRVYNEQWCSTASCGAAVSEVPGDRYE